MHIISISLQLVIILYGILCQNFDSYVDSFYKVYGSASQRIYRQQIYIKKWEFIKESNSQNLGYLLGENQFTDRTDQQALQMAGLITPSPSTPNLFLSSTNSSDPSQYQKVQQSAELPLQVDWRSMRGGKVSGIKNQGSCGSCWCFVVTALYESILMIGGMSQPDLSEQYLLQCTSYSYPQYPPSDCSGGYLDPAMRLAVRNGLPSEREFGYRAGKMTKGMPSTAGICTTMVFVKDTTINGKYVGNYFSVSNNDMKTLISYAPVAVALYSTKAFLSYKSGIFSGCPDYMTSIRNLNHAVLVVGYDLDGNYIIKNSWGSGWGKGGFALVSKEVDCGITYTLKEIRGSNQAIPYDPLQNVPIDFGGGGWVRVGVVGMIWVIGVMFVLG